MSTLVTKSEVAANGASSHSAVEIAGGSSMTVDLSGVPHTVRVAVGERLVLPLPSYAGSGNVWSVSPVHGPDVARVAIEGPETEVRPVPAGDGVAEPPALMLVPERAVVYGLAPGQATWRLTLARPFAPSTPAATLDLAVTVAGTP